MLVRRNAARQPPLTCLPELRRALLDEWCNIPPNQIDNLILSIPRRCRRPGQGRRRATKPNEDRYLELTARRDRNMNATLLQHLRSGTGTTVSTQSV
ncbi:hypothetical protein TNCV_3017871 [Trichonephila clavipes]|nr:hypothetical protein TNCV_3017871 [Trichonephila clavipes]